MKIELTQTDRKRFQHLVMAAIDNELSPPEQIEFDHFIKTYDECKQEWQEYQKMKEVTNKMRLKSPSSEVWDSYWRTVYNRIERSVAWILISVSCTILLIYLGFKAVESLLADSNIVGIVKVAVLLAVAGFMILFISVVREKFFTGKSDPYKEIQR